jgi:hypothetical protein
MISAKKLNKFSSASDKNKQERLEKEEYGQDKKDMDRESLKERLKHHQDAVKNLEKEINSLQKDKKEDIEDVKKESDAGSDKQKAAREKFLEMIRKKKGDDKESEDKKSSKKDESKAKSKAEWDNIDKKELKRDTKKEKKGHEKDAVKDDQSKISKLKKGAPSEKKSVEIHDLKKDEKFDKARAADAVKIEVKKQGEVLEVDIEEAAQKFFGGKKRSNLKSSDFLFPAKRSFPIATPSDVPDAVSNFGRMSGNMSYDEFKKKLVSFVKKKGAKFVAALPNTIKKEFDLADATQIAVFPDKYVDPKDVGTVFQDTRPINYEGYEIDDKIQEQVKKDKLKNPQLRSAQQRAEGLR